jgi:acyl-CoA thioester hydrolase
MTAHNLLADFPVVIETPVAWGEMDAFGHVNNVVYFRYFESGRIAYFRRLGMTDFLDQSGVGPILASVNCRFKFPLTFPDTIWVGAAVSEIGDDRFTMRHRIVSQRHDRIAAEGEGVIVTYHYGDGRKAPLPDPVRNAILQIEGAHVKTNRS